MRKIIPMQSVNCSNLDQSKPCSFDLEVIDKATSPLLHQSARFWLITGGMGKVRIQNVVYKLKPGTVVAILPWQITEVVEVLSPLQYYLVAYQIDLVCQGIKSLYSVGNDNIDINHDISNSPVIYCDSKQLNIVTGIFLAIREEMGIESMMPLPREIPLNSIFTTIKLIDLTVMYLRVGKQNNTNFGMNKLSIDPSEILQYMYNHLNEKLTLKDLSLRFYMSKSSISHYIRQVTNLSFFDLLNEMRVGKTINFLLYTELTLEELAEILGYVDASHVSKVFAARLGIRANEYRKTYQRVGEICMMENNMKAYKIVDYIFHHFDDDITPQSIAAEFHISVHELQRTLLYQVERSFEDFLNYLRVNRASKLLLETEKGVLDIAIEVGYNNSKTLVRNFLKFHMMTPSKFRKEVNLQHSDFA